MSISRVIGFGLSRSNTFVRHGYMPGLPPNVTRSCHQSSPPSTSPSSDASLPRVDSAPAERTSVSESTPELGAPRTSSLFETLSKATVIGRTGGPARIHDFGDAESATFSVATNHMKRDGDGKRIATQWHNVQVHETTPGYTYLCTLPTGSLVYVEGYLRLVRSERDGVSTMFANVNVSRGSGLFRVLRRPYRSTDVDDSFNWDTTDPNMPF